MRILITTIGSHGDIHPYVGIGQSLLRRGHEVALLANPYFKQVALDAGLDFIPVGDHMDLREIAQNPHLMGAYSGTRRIMGEVIIPEAPNFFRTLETQFKLNRPDAVLTHHICFGSTWACRKHRVPVAVGCLSPLAWPCVDDPAYFLPLVKRDPSRRAMKWWLRVARYGSMLFYDPALNRHRRSFGLPKGTNWLLTESRGGDINLALWSRQYRAPLDNDPTHGHICGFVWFDRHRQQEHAEHELESFLNSGDPPIIFTLGTSAVHVAGPFYQAAADACKLLNRRGLLLTGHPEYAPKSLPDGVAAFTYAPFSSILPRGCATVHHGGIGTTAQSLRAGRPTTIVPFAHDQFDNAARARRLGVSATVPRSKVSAETLAAALKQVLDDPKPASYAARLGQVLNSEDGAEIAADKIESMVNARMQPELACR
jgi:MGT family glycosyltransferase